MAEPIITVSVEDVRAMARENFGADVISPGEDWRLSFTLPGGAHVTMHRHATAADVAAYVKREADGG